eukprot:TRINITY_DN12909_c0_g1_i1.p1 TRINITY_DN12909_c0_g1~~TRINITY_DN12909_c0_g1_i1.p1  ORF type:complete len:388 (+),score=110.59 TRINITY_DN12909_c0_g1_i1:95-1258(+)
MNPPPGEDLTLAARSEIVPDLTDDEVPPEYSEFLRTVDEKSKMRFLNWLPRELKQQVMARGSLHGAANPSAALEYRMEIAAGGPLIPPLEHFLKAHQLGDDISAQLRALPDQTQAAIIGRGGFKSNETQQAKERILYYRISAEKSKEAARFKEEYRKLLQRAEEVGDIVFRDPRKRADSGFAKLPQPVVAKKPEQKTMTAPATRILKDLQPDKGPAAPVADNKQNEAVNRDNEKKDAKQQPAVQKTAQPSEQKVDMSPIQEINELQKKQQELAARATPVVGDANKEVRAAGSAPSAGLQGLIDKSRQQQQQQQQQQPPSPAVKSPKDEKKEAKVKRELIDVDIDDEPSPPDLSHQIKRPRSGPTVEDLLVGVTSLIQRELRRNLTFP